MHVMDQIRLPVCEQQCTLCKTHLYVNRLRDAREPSGTKSEVARTRTPRVTSVAMTGGLRENRLMACGCGYRCTWVEYHQLVYQGHGQLTRS